MRVPLPGESVLCAQTGRRGTVVCVLHAADAVLVEDSSGEQFEVPLDGCEIDDGAVPAADGEEAESPFSWLPEGRKNRG